MALRLRRGTNAERLTITPESGEIIYVTDSKKLYVGDGSTVGGNLVSGVNDIIDDTTPQLGGDLDLNGNDIVGNGNIDINGTITATGNINLGDGAGSDVISIGGEVNGNLIPTNDESFTLGSPARRWQAIWGSSAVIDGQIDAVAVNADIIADDSTVAFRASTGEFTGNLVGNVTGSIIGDVQGSVFGDDSTPIVDGVNNSISAVSIQTESIQSISSELAYSSNTNNSTFSVNSVDNAAILALRKSSSSDLSGTIAGYGRIVFGRDDINGPAVNALISGTDVALTLAVDAAGTFADSSKFVTWTGTNFGIGTGSPAETLDVRGNAVITGTVDAASFSGSLVGDDSTTIIDAIDGSITASNFVQFGSLTTTERNTLTAAAGMVIWNSTTTQFEGYDGTNWINLVDGVTSA